MEILYHASSHKNLPVIKPQKTLSKDIYIGEYVFATSNPKLAAMYLVTLGTRTIMNTPARPHHILIGADAKLFSEQDQ